MLRDIITSIKNLSVRAQDIRRRKKLRAMQLCETLSLGERRFLLLVKVEKRKFLVGAAGTSISLLAELHSPEDSPAGPRLVNDDALFDNKESRTWK